MNIQDLKKRVFGEIIFDSVFSLFYSSNEEKIERFINREEQPNKEFSLEEILEELLKGKNNILKNKNLNNLFLDENLEEKTLQEKLLRLNNTTFIVEEEKLDDRKIFLYEIFPNTYYVYLKKRIQFEEEKKEKEKNKKKNEIYDSFGYFSLFVPTGVIVSRVPQSILGNGVLGRAFIYSNYIEVLESLIGNEYIEVLTHEVLHIMYPEKKENEIRMITKNYFGNTVYN